MLPLYKARPRLATQKAQLVSQYINWLRSGADFTIPGLMQPRDNIASEGFAQTEADYICTNGFAHYSAPGKDWNSQCIANYSWANYKTAINAMWNEYLEIPSWETYKNNWSTLDYNVIWGHFFIMSRETNNDNLALGIASGCSFGSVLVLDFWN